MGLKENLSVRGIEFESINIASSDEARQQLSALGAQTVPVVALGDEFITAELWKDVVEFLGLDEDVAGPELPPAELFERLRVILAAAERYTSQLPRDQLLSRFADRDRSYADLCLHIFRVAEVFLDAAEGSQVTVESLMTGPSPALLTSGGFPEYAQSVQLRLDEWWRGAPSRSFDVMVSTYLAPQTLHEFLERTAWHCAQHTRHLMMVLDRLEIAPDRPLTERDLAGLPLPTEVWT